MTLKNEVRKIKYLVRGCYGPERNYITIGIFDKAETAYNYIEERRNDGIYHVIPIVWSETKCSNKKAK